MTEIKTISISKINEGIYERLNQLTPDDMGFSEQVANAVAHFVESETGTIDSYINDRMPDYLVDDMDEWKKYFANHPEQMGDIMRRHVQMGNIMRQMEYNGT